MRNKNACYIVVLSLLLLSCNAQVKPPTAQDVLAQTAKAIEAISIAANNAVKTVLQIMPEPSPQREKILGIIGKVVLADSHAKNIVIALEGLPLITPSQIANAVIPILKEIRLAIDEGMLGMSSEDRKQAQFWLDVIAINVISAQGILELYGSPNNPGDHQR